jgi:hypothetical protein
MPLCHQQGLSRCQSPASASQQPWSNSSPGDAERPILRLSAPTGHAADGAIAATTCDVHQPHGMPAHVEKLTCRRMYWPAPRLNLSRMTWRLGVHGGDAGAAVQWVV